MQDVLYYMNYSPDADKVVMVLCTVIFFLLNTSYVERTINLKIFKLSNHLLFLSATSSVIYHYMLGDIKPGYTLPIYFLRYATFFCLAAVSVSFIVYIIYLCDIHGLEKKLLIAYIIAVSTLFVIFEFLPLFTHYGFWIDANLAVHQNYYYDPYRYAYMLYTSVLLFIIFRHRKMFITKMYWCTLGVASISLAFAVLEDIFRSTSFMAISYELPYVAFLCMFHYNSYDSRTGTLNEEAFFSYIGELIEDNITFSGVCLDLPNNDISELAGLSHIFYHFNEKYFKKPLVFRLRSTRFLAVYRQDENENAKDELPVLYSDFKELYERHTMDYMITYFDSTPALSDPKDYSQIISYKFHHMQMNDISPITSIDVERFNKRLFISNQLNDIVSRGNLADKRVKVYCQPVFNVKSQMYTTAEALMRLDIPGMGMVFPDEFIPIAEDNGCIHFLSLIILNKTCMAIRDMLGEGYEVERISVNFSMVELREPDFVTDIISIIDQSKISYDKIAIELTETRNERDFNLVKKVMDDLQRYNMMFYLDDFGTGYSNFERLIDLPIDIIKFDRSLTIMSGKDADSFYMIERFAEIFKRQNYKILFEGVEDESDESRCMEMNAMYLQGYKYSKPTPIDNLRKFLECRGA